MKTPITDDALDKWACGGTSSETIIPAMRRLELDRAALMEAMELLLSGAHDYQTGIEESRVALAAARANFPTE